MGGKILCVLVRKMKRNLIKWLLLLLPGCVAALICDAKLSLGRQSLGGAGWNNFT